MVATECNFNFRSQKIETARNSGGRGVGAGVHSLVPSCGVEKRGKLMREEEEKKGMRARAKREGSQKGN